MSLQDLCDDLIIIRKTNGSSSGPHKCSVQGENIYILDGTVDVDDGDSVERELPNGKVETYTVLEAQFQSGLHSIPDSWDLHVRKVTSLKPKGGRTTNIHIESANAIQIGDHNVQHVTSILQSLIAAIEQSGGSAADKTEAKSRLAEFLKHPAVAATLGAAASTVVKSMLGA